MRLVIVAALLAFCVSAFGQEASVQTDTEKIKALEKENAALRLAVDSQKAQAAALKAENSQLREALNKTAAKPSVDKSAAGKRLTLEALLDVPAEGIQSIVGSRVFGYICIEDIVPDKFQKDKYEISATASHEDVRGEVSFSKTNRIVYVAIVFALPERNALKLRKGDQMNLAGDVVAVSCHRTPPTRNYTKTVDRIKLELMNTSAN